LSVTSDRLSFSVISCQYSMIGCQPPAISGQFLVVSQTAAPELAAGH